MKIPDYEQLMLPMLELAESGNPVSLEATENYMARKFQLTKKQRLLQKKSGPERLLRNRIGWTRMYLKNANLVTYPKPGFYKITPEGQKALEEVEKKKLEGIDTNFLRKFSNEFNKWYTQVLKAKQLAQKERKAKHVPKRNGVIVLLDALGVREIWKDGNSNEAMKSWTFFTQNFEKQIKKGLGRSIKTQFSSFSDTIVITAYGKKIEKILIDIAPILASRIIDSMYLGFPIRGCISIGEFYQKKNLIIGKAINEAAEYYELPQWIGISATPSANLQLEKMENSKSGTVSNVYQRFDIPLKKSIELNAWAVDWIKTSYDYIDKLQKSQTTGAFSDIPQIIYEKTKRSPNLSAALKWRNTAKFYDSVNR